MNVSRDGEQAPSGEVEEERMIGLQLRPRAPLPSLASIYDQPLKQRRYLSRWEFSNACGARPEDLERMVTWSQNLGLTVVDASIEKRLLVLSGPILRLQALFAPDLQSTDWEELRSHAKAEPPRLHPDIVDLVQRVFGLDDAPFYRSHVAELGPPLVNSELTIHCARRRYGFPDDYHGCGQRVAIVEYDIGYELSDLAIYYRSAVYTPVKIHEFSLLKSNNPGINGMGATLDLSVVGTLAPDAEIDVYFAPNTELGALYSVASILHDIKYPLPDALSISYAKPEQEVSSQLRAALDEEFLIAALLGVTVCCSSGNGGQTAGRPSGEEVEFPASSPHVLACGGTETIGNICDPKVPEVAWGTFGGKPNEGSGGGLSSVFPPGPWQVPMLGDQPNWRGLPDVASYSNGYQIYINGEP